MRTQRARTLTINSRDCVVRRSGVPPRIRRQPSCQGAGRHRLLDSRLLARCGAVQLAHGVERKSSHREDAAQQDLGREDLALAQEERPEYQ